MHNATPKTSNKEIMRILKTFNVSVICVNDCNELKTNINNVANSNLKKIRVILLTKKITSFII
jgi:hypothetical protein